MKRKPPRPPLAAVLATLLLAPSVGAPAQDWVAFETIDQSALPIVRASVNGITGHRLVLDVGFTDLLLDTMLVDGAGLELVTRGEVQEIDFYGRTEVVPVAYLQSLVVGVAEFQLVRTLLIDGEDGTGMGGLRSYGRIGRDILEPLRVTVHYPRQLLLFEESPDSEVPPGGIEFQTAGRFLLLPVLLEREDETIEAQFVLDPGTSATLVDRRFAQKNGFAEKRATDVRLPAIQAGGFRAEGVPVLLGDIESLPYAGRPVGVIGADVLRTISVTYDFARDLVWLTRVEPAASPE